MQQLLHPDLKTQHDEAAAGDLQELRRQGRLLLKMRPPGIHLEGQPDGQRRADQLPEVLDAAGIQGGIPFSQPGGTGHVQQNQHDHGQGKAAGQRRADLRVPGRGEERLQQKEHGQGQQRAAHDIHRRVHPQIKAGEGNQHRQNDPGDPEPFLPEPEGHAAVGADTDQGMSAGEGPAVRPVAEKIGLPGGGNHAAFHLRIQQPGAGNPEKQLHGLAEAADPEAGGQHVQAAPLGEAPEDDEGEHHEELLVPQISQYFKKPGERLKTQVCQPMQKGNGGSGKAFHFSDLLKLDHHGWILA